MTPLKAPFPWFGGKRRAAGAVWRAFGPDVPNYVEPFAGSLAVLLGRPGGAGKIETVNDRDRMLSNFWRGIQHDPEGVAHFADWPVNEADMHARHVWLVQHLQEGSEFIERMHTDPDFYDAKIAGWWVYGICIWIGAGWCAEPGASKDRMVRSRQRPDMRGDSMGMGIHGVHSSIQKRPEMGNAGKGVHLPALGNDRGLNGVASPPCVDWFRELQARLRRVRVACGDWKRVLGPSVLGKGKNVGGRRPCAVFLDPPYDPELRDRSLYSTNEPAIAVQVREWALEHGDDPDLRIALCGYEGEHEMPSSWRVHAWKGTRGYAGADNENRHRERIWFSPHCLHAEDRQQSLFDAIAARDAEPQS